MVDVHKGTIILRMNDQQIKFNVNDTLKCPAKAEECSAIYKLTKNPTNSWKQQQKQDNGWNNCIKQQAKWEELSELRRVFESLEPEDFFFFFFLINEVVF